MCLWTAWCKNTEVSLNTFSKTNSFFRSGWYSRNCSAFTTKSSSNWLREKSTHKSNEFHGVKFYSYSRQSYFITEEFFFENNKLWKVNCVWPPFLLPSPGPLLWPPDKILSFQFEILTTAVESTSPLTLYKSKLRTLQWLMACTHAVLHAV